MNKDACELGFSFPFCKQIFLQKNKYCNVLQLGLLRFLEAISPALEKNCSHGTDEAEKYLISALEKLSRPVVEKFVFWFEASPSPLSSCTLTPKGCESLEIPCYINNRNNNCEIIFVKARYGFNGNKSTALSTLKSCTESINRDWVVHKWCCYCNQYIFTHRP